MMNTEKCAVDEYMNGDDGLKMCTAWPWWEWKQFGPDGTKIPEDSVYDNDYKEGIESEPPSLLHHL